MKVSLRRVNDRVLFQAKNELSNSIFIDGKPVIGGVDAGFRPMELLLAGIGGCSIMDIISILKKQKQDLQDITIDVTGERPDGGDTSIFTKIELHYVFTGDVQESKAKKAIELGLYKYCSVGEMLSKDAEILYTFEVKPG